MTAILLLIRKYWLQIAIILAVLAAIAYIHQRAYNRGQAEVQGKFDAYKTKLSKLTAEAAALARKARDDYETTSDQAQKAYDDGRQSGLLANQTVVDDLRADRKRLQNGWGACLAAPGGKAQGVTGRADESAGVPPEAFGRVLQVGSDADSQVMWLQTELLATRKLYESCHAVGGADGN